VIIDCDQCAMQHTSACDDCVVGFLLGKATDVELCDVEVSAIGHLAEAGLVSPIRLMPRLDDSGEAAG
jgi:hypothetical protein